MKTLSIDIETYSLQLLLLQTQHSAHTLQGEGEAKSCRPHHRAAPGLRLQILAHGHSQPAGAGRSGRHTRKRGKLPLKPMTKAAMRYGCRPHHRAAPGLRLQILAHGHSQPAGQAYALELGVEGPLNHGQQKLSRFPVPENIWDEYHLDQEINDRGIGVDMELVRQAYRLPSRSLAGVQK